MTLLREYLTIKKIFTRKVVEDIIKKPSSEILKIKQRRFHFVVVQIDELANNVELLISNLCEMAVIHHATVGEIISSIIVLYYGLFEKDNSNLNKKRLELVDDIAKNFGSSTRIIHGEIEGKVGIFGCSNRSRYGALIPNFSEKLNLLFSISFGEHRELK